MVLDEDWSCLGRSYRPLSRLAVGRVWGVEVLNSRSGEKETTVYTQLSATCEPLLLTGRPGQLCPYQA